MKLDKILIFFDKCNGMKHAPEEQEPSVVRACSTSAAVSCCSSVPHDLRQSAFLTCHQAEFREALAECSNGHERGELLLCTRRVTNQEGWFLSFSSFLKFSTCFLDCISHLLSSIHPASQFYSAA